MTCERVSAQLVAYLAGVLPEAEAASIEVHASGCARCEAALEAATRIDVAAFAPAVPTDRRAHILAAVAATTVAPSRRWRGLAAVAAVATMAAALVLMTERRAPNAASTLAGATAMARAQAASEFQSLDAAAAELEAALKAAPTDTDVQSYLDAVRARRAELVEKVAEAAS
jgi:hypothetical protein